MADFRKKAEIRASGKFGGLIGELKKTQKQTAGLKSSFDKVKKSAGALTAAYVAFKAVTGSISAVIDAHKKQAEAVARVDNAFRSMGRDAGATLRNLKKQASELQAVGIFGDEEIIAAQAVLATFPKIADEQMGAATQTVVDFAAQTGSSMAQAAKIIGQASDGMVGSMSRYGISLSDSTKKSKDFGAIMDDINSQVGGANEKIGTEAVHSLTRLNNAWGDLMETIGEALTEFIGPAVEKFTALLSRVNEVLTRSELDKQAEHLAAVKKELEHVLTLTQEDYKNDRFQTWESDVKRLREEIAKLETEMAPAQAIKDEEDAAAKAKADAEAKAEAEAEAERKKAEAAAKAAEEAAEEKKKREEREKEERERAQATELERTTEMEREKWRRYDEIQTAAKIAQQERDAAAAAEAEEKHAETLELSTQRELEKWQLRADIEIAANAQALERAAEHQAKLEAIEEGSKDHSEKLEKDNQKAREKLVAAGQKAVLKLFKEGSKEAIVAQAAMDIGGAGIDYFSSLSANTAWAAQLGPVAGPPYKLAMDALATKTFALSVAGITANAALKFNEGGIVPGGAPYSDRVPAMLTPGESVNTRNQESAAGRLLERLDAEGGLGGGANIVITDRTSGGIRAEIDEVAATNSGRDYT